MGFFSSSIDDSDWCEQVRDHYNYMLIQDLPTDYVETLRIDLKEGEGVEDDVFRKAAGCAWVVSSCKEAQKQLKGIPDPKSDYAKDVRSNLLKSFKALVWSAEDGIKWANRAINIGMDGLVDKRGQEYRKRHLEWGTEGLSKLETSVAYIGKNDLD